MIFVQIASYRDSELLPTVLDCIAKADNPEQLRFGIVEQLAYTDTPLPAMLNVDIIRVKHSDSKGTCWARAKCNSLYRGEEYTLQIDSHTRFVESWDTQLKDLLVTVAGKPIISTYPHMYTKVNGKDQYGKRGDPISIAFVFYRDRLPVLSPVVYKFDKPLINARAMAGGFIFCKGKFITEVPYDPSLYFVGEEISLSIRAFTHGYDMYHPSDIPLYHFYERPSFPKHGNDFNANALNAASLKRVDAMLSGKHRWGMGVARSLADYEQYAEVNFLNQTLSQNATHGREPGVIK
jgi:hypothetical protein